MVWMEGQKTLGSGSTLTIKLPKGKHSITLKVDDGRKNGNASATVQILVRYIDFSAQLTVDTEMPVEGKNIILTAVLRNRGDGSIDELPVSFRIDGTEVSATTIENIGPDSSYPLEFQWKAVKGDHKFEVSVNNQNFSKLVAVEKKPAAAAEGGGDMMLLAGIAIIAVVAVAAGALVLAGRRRRAAQSAEEDMRTEEPQEEAVPFQPARKAKAPAKAPAAARTELAAGEADAKAAISKTEKILADADKVGLDTTKARQLLKVARNMQGMGKHAKAVEFCKKAEDSIE
jgi:hypothetical protein